MMISFMLLCVSSTIDKRLNGLGSRRCDMACDMVCDMCACLYARPADKIKNKTKQKRSDLLTRGSRGLAVEEVCSTRSSCRDPILLCCELCLLCVAATWFCGLRLRVQRREESRDRARASERERASERARER